MDTQTVPYQPFNFMYTHTLTEALFKISFYLVQ